MPRWVTTQTPEKLQKLSYWLVGSGLLTSIGLVLLLVWIQPVWVLGIPLLILGMGAVAYLSQKPLLHLTVVLAGFVLISGEEPGMQPEEVIYGLYYLAFLGMWFISRFFIYRDNILYSSEDKALFIFLLYATASVCLTLLFQGSLQLFVGEWLSITMLAFYFPVKEACRRYRRAPYFFLGVIIWFGLFGSVRNLFLFQEALQSAEQAWQILRGRVALNEIFFLMAALTTAVLTLYASNWRSRIGFAGLLGLFTTSLIITQSRGYWVAFFAGSIVIFLTTDRKRQIRSLGISFLGLALLTLVGLLFYSSSFKLFLTGAADRAFSIPLAIVQDVSLLNRYQETKHLWTEIQKNPVLGYGMGVKYQYFNIIPTVQHTREWSFVHNGYAALWYKFGIVGLGTMLFFWFQSIRQGLRLFNTSSRRIVQLSGLAAAAGLLGETLVAHTSNPFILSDGCLLIALLAGLIAGSWQPPYPSAADDNR